MDFDGASPAPNPGVRGELGRCRGRTSLEFEVWVFEETIEQDDEFAHDGSESDHLDFAGGTKALVKVFEDLIVADGAQSGHVESAAHGGPAPANEAHATSGAPVAVVWSEAS